MSDEDFKNLTDLFNLLRWPIPWDPIMRFRKDYREILTKEQQLKFAGLSARYQAEAIKIQKEYEAQMSELQVQAGMDLQKTMGGAMK